MAYGIAFDTATLDRECKVDEEGASVDDLEEVAKKYGIDAEQVMIFPEHVLLPAAKQLPAILIVKPPTATLQFWLAWRAAGDRVRQPRAGGGCRGPSYRSCYTSTRWRSRPPVGRRRVTLLGTRTQNARG
jgi:ATP-binding cassette subfamily B protein